MTHEVFSREMDMLAHRYLGQSVTALAESQFRNEASILIRRFYMAGGFLSDQSGAPVRRFEDLELRTRLQDRTMRLDIINAGERVTGFSASVFCVGGGGGGAAGVAHSNGGGGGGSYCLTLPAGNPSTIAIGRGDLANHAPTHGGGGVGRDPVLSYSRAGGYGSRSIPENEIRREQAVPSRDAFLHLIASEVARLKPGFYEVSCLNIAADLLRDILACEGISFGDPTYRWTRAEAKDLVHGYLEHDE